MKRIKNYIFRKRSEKFLRNDKRIKRYVNYSSAKTILLIFESDHNEKNLYIRQIIKQLSRDGKKVFARGYLNSKQSVTPSMPGFTIYNRQSFDWLGQPKEPLMREMNEQEYDMLIDLNLNELTPLKYISLFSNAAMKAGQSSTERNLMLDFSIQKPEEEAKEEKEGDENSDKIELLNLNEAFYHKKQKFMFEQLIFYLKRIETKD